MKLLIFGRNGQVGREIERRVPSSFAPIFLDRQDADLAKPELCAEAIRHHKPDAVINAAAWTAVDRAEDHEAEATLINGDAPAVMARQCRDLNIPFLQISTDYVFDGSGEAPRRPDEMPKPINAYGRSKLAGERGIQEHGAAFLILRTSWVFSSHGQNFLKTMLRLGRQRQSLTVVSDQIGGPTPASEIADALLTAARRMRDGAPGGVYHFSGAPDVSWAGFARAIMATAHLSCVIEDIPSSHYKTPAPRPQNSRLDCESFRRDFQIDQPDWSRTIHEILSEVEV